jgi:hypothetical protein
MIREQLYKQIDKLPDDHKCQLKQTACSIRPFWEF